MGWRGFSAGLVVRALWLRGDGCEGGSWVLRTGGDARRVLARDTLLRDNAGDWFVNETVN